MLPVVPFCSFFEDNDKLMYLIGGAIAGGAITYACCSYKYCKQIEVERTKYYEKGRSAQAEIDEKKFNKQVEAFKLVLKDVVKLLIRDPGQNNDDIDKCLQKIGELRWLGEGLIDGCSKENKPVDSTTTENVEWLRNVYVDMQKEWEVVYNEQ